MMSKSRISTHKDRNGNAHRQHSYSKVALCHGKSHKRIQLENVFTVDSDISTHPDLLSTVEMSSKTFPNNSLDAVYFVYCPTSVYENKKTSEWFKKPKIGKYIIIYGHSYRRSLSTEKNNTEKTMKDFLLYHMKRSHTIYKKMLFPKHQPHIILKRIE